MISACLRASTFPREASVAWLLGVLGKFCPVNPYRRAATCAREAKPKTVLVIRIS